MTGDDAGIIHLFNWSSLIDEGKDLSEVLQASRHLASRRPDDEDVGEDDGVRYHDEDVGGDADIVEDYSILDKRISVLRSSFVTLVLPPLDS